VKVKLVFGSFLIFLSATGFGVLPILALYAYESGVSLTSLLFLRFAFAAIFFFGYLILKSQGLRITKHQFFVLFILGGILYMLQSTFYFSAVKFIPASLAALLLYLYPIFVAVLSFFVNKENLSGKLIFSISLSLVGMILVLGTPMGKISPLGVFLASGAALVYSFYIIIGDKVTSQVSPLVTSAYISLFASFSFLIGGLVMGNLNFKFQAFGWLPILGIALFSSVLAMITFFAGMKITGPTKASILSMLEPVVTILLSAMFFQDKMSMIQMIGGGIVLAGAVLVVITREKIQTFEEVKKVV
jgi:drug/metabolite transporter (DMT)-like permease